MSASDVSMSLEEFSQYWRKNSGLIKTLKAYDAASRKWVDGEAIFRAAGAYTLIVVRFRNGHFLRVNVTPSLEIAYGPEKYANPVFWRERGVNLTYEEKEFLRGLGDEALTLRQLIKAIAASDFQGKDALIARLLKAPVK